jgi:pimeloyl-ACP methyl ester carboxylesterase
MSAFTVGGDLVHYEVLGRGRQVVLVHSWVGSWRYWIPTMQQLQAKFRVYALDLYGFGDTGKNPAKYSLEHQVELLADFTRELGIPKAAFIGHGLGALVVTEFARRYPDRVPRMMLIEAPLFDPGNLEERVPAGRKVMLTNNRPAVPVEEVKPEPPPNAPTIMSASAAMRAALLEAARAKAATGTVPELTDVTMERAEIYETPGSNPLLDTITDAEVLLARSFKKSEPEFEKLRVDVVKTDARALRGCVAAFDAGSMLDTLRLLPIPTVVLHGQDDAVIPPPSDTVWNYITLDKENTLLPIPLPNVRHFPMLEYDLFQRLMSDFLEVPDISKLEVKERWRRRTR